MHVSRSAGYKTESILIISTGPCPPGGGGGGEGEAGQLPLSDSQTYG